MNALDVDGALKWLTDDADFTFIADAQLFPPKDSMQTKVRADYATIKSLHFAWDAIRVTVLSPDAAVFSGTGRNTHRPANK